MCAIVGNLNRFDELLPLTEKRPLATLPFDCKYRLIDFNLSNIVNANINTIFMVFNERKTQSVFDHIGGGREWDLDNILKHFFTYVYPEQNKTDSQAYYDMIIDYLIKSKSEYTVYMSSKILCNIDFRAVLKVHQTQASDMTVVYKRVMKEQIHETDCLLKVGEDGKIIATNTAGSLSDVPEDELHNLCADIFIIKTNRLIELLEEVKVNGLTDYINKIFRDQMTSSRVSTYEYTGYLSNIFSVKHYFDANMDMLDVNKFNSLLYTSRKVYTKVKNEVPTYYAESSEVKKSHFATGSIIEGEVRESIISRRTEIKSDALVEHSILMPKAVIGEKAHIKYAILDKYVQVQPGIKIIGTAEHPVVIPKGSLVTEDIIEGD